MRIETLNQTGQPAAALEEVVAGRYQLERLIARGGMGEVFAALDLSTGARIALKRMLAEERKQRSLVVNFMREYHALSELRHPRIIAVYDYGVDGSGPYYTMELLDGQDLRELSPVPYRDACRYLRDVASSLALLHARRLLHRDLSPRNVRRTSDGRCKLLDFGAMVPFGVPATLTGTPPCVPPEALQGSSLDQRSDLYALGALAYFVLTGRYAHPATEIGALPQLWKKPIVRPKRLVRDIPESLDDLVISLLSMNPKQRPTSAAEVIDRLSAAGDLEPQSDGDDSATARSFFTSSQLFGREAQCSQLQKHVDRTLAGRGSALLVSGESGTGRSRMLAEAALLGQTSGLTVVCTTARSRGAISSLAIDIVQGLVQAAPQEAEEANTNRPLLASQTFAAGSGETRVQALNELAAFVRDVARARPLLITIDDLDRADDFSGALAAALAHQSAECPLTVIASFDSRHEPPMLAKVPGLAETMTLRPLDRAQTQLLAATLFGEVPNLERVSDWLFRVAAGNPKLTLQLAEHLLAQDVVRYVDGTWVLPARIDGELPPSAAEALLLRLAQLGPAARALAELLCVSRAAASTKLVIELCGQGQQEHAAVFAALEELVSRGVLESAGGDYVFAQDALRETLLESLAPQRRRELHSTWAERLLAGVPDDADGDSDVDRLEAGWHLTHTDDELRGADLLAKIAPDWVDRRVRMALAVPALERALEIYERHGRPLGQRLYLRSHLVMSSFLYDHSLAERHAEATLDALYPFTGLARVERLSRSLGKRAAFFVGMLWTWLRWLLQPRAARGPNVIDALKYYARASMGLVGLRALAIDVAGIRAGLERMRAFEGSPHPSLRILHSLARAISLHNEGRGPDMVERLEALLHVLGSRSAAPLQMNDAERIDLLSGALLLQGINECYRARSDALNYARRLEELGTPIAVAAAMRICLIYHLLRGESERTQHYRRQVDLAAITTGTVWQIEWISVPIEGLAGATWSDLIMMRRALDALETLMLEVPSFANMRDNVRIAYHFRRGDYATTVQYGEQYMADHAPFTLIGWATCHAHTALAYLELGHAQRALEICEHARGLIPGHHLQWMIHYSGLEAAHATVLAALGERERSQAMFDALMERLRAAGEHTRASLMHEYRVKAARLLGDRAGMLAALSDMREAALASGNPSAILLADSLQDRRTRARSSPLPPAKLTDQARDVETVSGAREETIVTSFLRGEQVLRRRAQHALHMLGQYASSNEGYLYWVRHGALQLAASLDQREPPSALQVSLSNMPANDHNLELSPNAGSYTVVRLLDAANSCVGVAALRDITSSHSDIPDSLIYDIGRALTAGGSR